MGRLTVRLPDTLHIQLTTLAAKEGISLNQYIVYALTRQTALAYTVESVSRDETERQRRSFAELLARLGEGTAEEIERVLEEREVDEPGSELEGLAVSRLREKVAARQ